MFMFVYFGVEMNNECKISELQWVLFIFYHQSTPTGSACSSALTAQFVILIV